MAGRRLQEISSASGQDPQSAHPLIKDLYCQNASGYLTSFTQVKPHAHAYPLQDSPGFLPTGQRASRQTFAQDDGLFKHGHPQGFVLL